MTHILKAKYLLLIPCILTILATEGCVFVGCGGGGRRGPVPAPAPAPVVIVPVR